MASIRKRGSSYLLVVSMGYDYKGNRIKPKQKTVHPPEGLTPKQKEKWLNEQAVLFERECKGLPQEVDRSITLAKYTELWLRDHRSRQAGQVHPGPGAAGHRPLPAGPGQSQTDRASSRALPPALCRSAKSEEPENGKAALRVHR